jgi:hypothetical protein
MGDIINIINEELTLLAEGLSDTLYHYTSFSALQNILSTNKLNTSSNLGTPADAQKDRGRAFYFSTQRTKGKTGFGYNTGGGVTLVLNGRALQANYKGFPTDYWNWSMNPKDYSDKQGYIQALRSKEHEDRIVTDKPYIEPASRYIEAIHIDLSNPWYIKKSDLVNIDNKAKSMAIPIYFYDNRDSYQLQDIRKAKSLDTIQGKFQDEDEEPYTGSRKHFYWIFKELMPYIAFNTNRESEFWKLFMDFLKSEGKAEHFNDYKREIDEKIDNVSRFYSQDRYKDWYHIEDKYRSLMSDLHNQKSSTDPYYREFLKLLVADMRDFNANNFKEYLVNKLGLRPEGYWDKK